jgi:hypothetical protein
MNQPLSIIKVLRVVDTRQYEEGPNDKWIPIPGSGNENQCFRCGRSHEVHAHVALADGREVICGTACGKEETAEVQGAIKSAASLAKRIAALSARVAADNATAAKYAECEAQVSILIPPAIEVGTGTFTVGMNAGKPFPMLICGDASIPCYQGTITDERRACVLSVWKGNRMKEAGAPHLSWGAGERARKLETLKRQAAGAK